MTKCMKMIIYWWIDDISVAGLCLNRIRELVQGKSGEWNAQQLSTACRWTIHNSFASWSSCGAFVNRSVNKIWQLLLENRYPPKLLRILLREIERSRSKRGRMPGNKSGGRNRKETDGMDGFLALPHIDEQLSRKITSIVRKYYLPVHIAWKNENKLNPRPAGVFGRTRPAGGGGRFCPPV